MVDGVAYVGSMTGELVALDVATGAVKWKYRAAPATDGIGNSSPAVAGGTVYVGDGQGGFTLSDANLPAGGIFGRVGVALGDVNGDGRDDLAWARAGGRPRR